MLHDRSIENGNFGSAARHFIDFWMGPGSWDHTPAERKPAIAKSVVNVRRWRHALTTEPTPLAAFARLAMPVLYLTGGRSPESAHAVARRLVPVLPRVTVQNFDKLGHMAPVTHPDVVNAAIAEFLKGV